MQYVYQSICTRMGTFRSQHCIKWSTTGTCPVTCRHLLCNTIVTNNTSPVQRHDLFDHFVTGLLDQTWPVCTQTNMHTHKNSMDTKKTSLGLPHISWHIQGMNEIRGGGSDVTNTDVRILKPLIHFYGGGKWNKGSSWLWFLRLVPRQFWSSKVVSRT